MGIMKRELDKEKKSINDRFIVLIDATFKIYDTKKNKVIDFVLVEGIVDEDIIEDAKREADTRAFMENHRLSELYKDE